MAHQSQVPEPPSSSPRPRPSARRPSAPPTTPPSPPPSQAAAQGANGQSSATNGARRELITQKGSGFRRGWPAWMRELPYLRLPPVREDFSLVDRIKLHQELHDADPAALEAIDCDLDLIDRELMPYFRDLDREASLQQNRYRLYQVGYIFLAMCATIIGALLALALRETPPRWVPLLSFLETVVALITVFLATISSRESPLSIWLQNRRCAESLRREVFRFLLNLPPYDAVEGYRRRMLLAERAALINRGTFPDEPQTDDGPASR